MQYGASLLNKLQRDLSNDGKKSEESEKKKRNKCNKGILQAKCWFIVKQTATVCSMVVKNPEKA